MLSIGEVADRAGLRASALRYYEEVGLLTPADRVSGRRRYDESALDRLRVIACAQSAGFTIAEIRELVVDGESSPEGWKPLARRKLREINALVEKAEAMRRLLEESLACDCRTLEGCSKVVGHAPAGGR